MLTMPSFDMAGAAAYLGAAGAAGNWRLNAELELRRRFLLRWGAQMGLRVLRVVCLAQASFSRTGPGVIGTAQKRAENEEHRLLTIAARTMAILDQGKATAGAGFGIRRYCASVLSEDAS